MKYKELPYVKLNGADLDGEEVPFRSRKSNHKCLFRKHASISCEVLNRVGRENAMNAQPRSDSTETNRNNYLHTDEFHGDRPGTRLTRNSFSCGATREEGSDAPSIDMQAKCSIEKQKGKETKIYEVVYHYKKAREDELDLAEGDTVRLLTEETGEKDWWYGEKEEGVKGLFPSQYVNLIGQEAREIPAGEIELITGDSYLGRGAFATVKKVLYKSKEAALKKPSRAEFFNTLKKEALMINRFKHPHIVELYGISTVDPQGLVLELCEGGSLKKLLNDLKSRFVSIRVLVEWAIQMSDAMKFVIQAHCIHRDLKTDNILIKESICLCNLLTASRNTILTEEFYNLSDELDRPQCDCGRTPLSRVTLKLTDFGLTKASREEDELKRQSQNIVGTLAYLAPEAFSKQQYSEASDVWSFGVILWSIFTKEEPYKDSEMICAFEVATNGMSSLEITDECPQQWKDIILSCWHALPPSRPSFADLNERFSLYKNNLQADDITHAEEATVHKAQQAVANFISRSSISRENHSIKDKMESKLLEISKIIDQATSVLDKKDKQDKLPFQLPRRKKIDKNQIGSPEKLRHLYSVINPDNRAQPSRNAENVIVIPNGAGHWKSNAKFSNSSPQLNMLGTEPHSLKRSDAIKRRIGGKHGLETEFASVEIAANDDIASCSNADRIPTLVNSPPRRNSPTNANVRRKFVNPSPHGTFGVANVPIRPAPRPNVAAPRKHRELTLNDAIPPSSYNHNNTGDRYIPLHSEPYALNTILPKKPVEQTNISMSPPTHSAPNFTCGPSTIIPLPSTRPAGQDENPYFDCGDAPPGVHRVVNNTYLNTSAATSHTPVINPHYICFQPVPNKRPSNLENRRVTPINNSAYVSLADQAPQTIAPPPPPTQSAISPPVIPPREGTVGLPPVRQVAS
ncbi:unnamed protein product [Auanema sp. JU1783]|nr:unnamed protein product [Auanema sp. JU1783]